MDLPFTPLISLIAGILILIVPRLLNYIVAIYLVIVGLVGLFPQLAGCSPAATAHRGRTWIFSTLSSSSPSPTWRPRPTS
jgi:hypothetical protein